MKPAMPKFASFSMILVMSLGALACGGGSKSAPPPPPPAAEPAPVAAAEPTGDVPTCEQVADHIIELFLTSEQYKNAKPEEQKQVQETMPEARAKVVEQCTDTPLPAEVRICVMKAQTLQDMDGCDKQ
jgi:hypothetical protein